MSLEIDRLSELVHQQYDKNGAYAVEKPVPITHCGAVSFWESGNGFRSIDSLVHLAVKPEECFDLYVALERDANGIATHYERPIVRTPFRMIRVSGSRETTSCPVMLLDEQSRPTGQLFPSEVEIIVNGITNMLENRPNVLQPVGRVSNI